MTFLRILPIFFIINVIGFAAAEARIASRTLRSSQASALRKNHESGRRGAVVAAASLANPSTHLSARGTPAPAMAANSGSGAFETIDGNSAAGLTAVPVNQSVTATKLGLRTNDSARFGGSLTNTMTTSVYESRSAKSTQEYLLEALSWWQVAPGYKIDLLATFSKQLTGERRQALKNSTVGFFHDPIRLGGGFLYRPKVSAQLPTDVEANKTTSFRSSVLAQSRLYFSPRAIRGLDTYYQISGLRNFYRFTTTGDGESNTAWRVSHRAVVSYTFNDQWALEVGPAIYTNWSFDGTPQTAFTHGEELSYSLNRRWGFAVGHSNEGSYYKDNGRDTNISVFDKDQSQLYVSVNHTF